MNTVTIIIPIYNEAANIPVLYQQLCTIQQPGFDFLFVDDGSTDASLLAIEAIAQTDPAVKCISFSRNFGHQNALMAGMEHATGDSIVIMDGDGQHPPALIPTLLKSLADGYDLVNTRRNSTADSDAFKNVSARLFYAFINRISDTRIEANVADFKAFNRKVLNGILQFKERELFLRGIFSWVGYQQTTIDFDAPARLHGQSKYSLGKMVRLALKGTTSFSFKPLRVALLAGSIVSIAAFGFACFAMFAYFNGNTVPGWASLIITVLFLGGTQLLAIGLLGEYIAGLFTEAKQRPRYLINQTINISND